MSRLIFDADTLGGTTTLSSADAVGNFTLVVPAVDGTLSVKDSSGDATFHNLTLTGAVLAGAWNGSTIAVAYGGTGATTLTGYVKGNGTSAMTASTTIPNTDITGLGTMSTQNANAVAISGGTISGLSAAIPVGSGGTGATTLTGYVKGNGTSLMTASATIPNTDITGLGTMSTQGSDAVTITGGTANGLTIGGTTAAAGIFTTLRFNSTLSANGNTGTSGQVLTSNGASAPTWQSIAGSGTVTSVDGSGGTTGLTLTGGPITSSGTLTLGGTLAVANGGTGSTTASAARTALGLGTMAVQAASSVAITGGAIDGTTVGSTTAAAASFTTLNSSGNTRLGGLSGNQSLQVNNVASAVNYAQIVGAVTGGAPTLSASGTDTNISLAYTSKGSGSHAFNTGGGQQFSVKNTASAVDYLEVSGNSGGFPSLQGQGASANVAIVYGTKGTGGHNFTTNGISVNQFVVTHTASAVNYLNLTGAATGAPVIITAQGSDTNVSLAYAPKGTGRHTFYSNSGTQLIIGNTASVVNYTQIDGAATGAAPTISAQGSDANIDLTLTPKGTGGVRFTGPLLPNNLAGTSGQVLTSAGAGAVPTWTTISASGVTAGKAIALSIIFGL